MTVNHTFTKCVKPQRVVILGKGFIGRNLYNQLLKEKINVLTVTRQEVDLIKENASVELAKILKPTDAIVFTSTIIPSKGKGLDPFLKNINMGKNVCEAIEKIGASHIIYISSDAVYSLDQEVISENTLTQPSDLYGVMHLARENMLKCIAKCPLVILRPTLIYGSEDPHRSYAHNRLRTMARESSVIKLFGKGEELRDHIYVEDVAHLAFLVILHKSYGILNVATGHSISYYDLAKKIKNYYGKEIEIEFSERRNKIQHRHFDISLLRKVFPNFSFTTIDEGTKLIYQYEILQSKK